MPRIEDTPSSNTPQSNTMSQNLTSDQEDSTLDPRQSGLVEETTQTNTNTFVSETQATSKAESTRDESQSSLLGECPTSASESAMEQYPVVMDEANVR